MLTIALPSGLLYAPAADFLTNLGITHTLLTPGNRKLRLKCGDDYALLVAKPVDVPIYVEYGAADLGIVGKDVLWENNQLCYELLDLGFGTCRLVLAIPENLDYGPVNTWGSNLRIATKYPDSAKRFFASHGIQINILKLNGSIELAPQVGLADGIVDLTATGKTLRENHLKVIAEIDQSTARLIANRVSMKLKAEEVNRFVEKAREAIRNSRRQV